MFFIDHIGWITRDISLFEKFWCGLLGYKEVGSSLADEDMMTTLFGAGPANIKRYHHPFGLGPDIEIHQFDQGSPSPHLFQRPGINHICLMMGGRGSREKFIETLPNGVKLKSYNNPRGWVNMFINDYEGNWIELREQL